MKCKFYFVLIHKIPAELCIMQHRGEILKRVIYEYKNRTGVSILAIARKAGYVQSTPYRHFEQENLAAYIIKKYGMAIGHDFSKEIPELEEQTNVMSDVDFSPYGAPANLADCIKQKEMWREKYIDLLERHNALLAERLGGDK